MWQTVGTNLRERLEEAAPSSDALSGNIMWALMHQLLDSDDDDDEDSSDGDQPGDCRPS